MNSLPRFFVSDASKGFNISASSLFAIYTGGLISVASKELTLHKNGAKGALVACFA